MKTLHFILILLSYTFNISAQSTQEQDWNNQNCGTLSFFEDSLLLHIPKDAFHENNKTIVGDVNIKVELYANYFDMLRKDIPMKDKSGLYVSGGMYQITVTKDDQEVTFHKELQVSYISDGINRFNAYKLDNNSLEWEKLSSPVLDYASKSSSSNSDDWGNLSPQNTETSDDEWGDDIGGWGIDLESYKQISDWLYKTMNISSNGIYNYDYLINNENLITYNIKVNNPDIHLIYVQYPHLNTVVYYDINQEGYAKEFSLINTDLSNVRIFTYSFLKGTKRIKFGEVPAVSILSLSSQKENIISFDFSEIPFTKTSLDQNLSSL